MKLWLSRSLFHEPLLFSWWNSGYHEAFFTNHFFFHDGILETQNTKQAIRGKTLFIYISERVFTRDPPR
jgi:hypothetical protein